MSVNSKQFSANLNAQTPKDRNDLRRDFARGCVQALCTISRSVPDTALVKWVSEYAVRAYTTLDSAVGSYHAQFA